MDQQPLAVAAAQHGKGRRGGAEHRHALLPGRGMADAARHRFGLAGILGGDDDRRQPSERRHRRFAPGLGFRRVEARDVAADQSGDDWRLRVVGLDQHAPGLVAAPGASGDLLDLLEAALGGAQVTALQGQVGIDHPDQGQIGEVVALGDQLRADDDVDLASVHCRDEFGGAWPATRWCRK